MISSRQLECCSINQGGIRWGVSFETIPAAALRSAAAWRYESRPPVDFAAAATGEWQSRGGFASTRAGSENSAAGRRCHFVREWQSRPGSDSENSAAGRRCHFGPMGCPVTYPHCKGQEARKRRGRLQARSAARRPLNVGSLMSQRRVPAHPGGLFPFVCCDCRRSFKRPLNGATLAPRPCPLCGGPAAVVHHKFKAPKASDVAQWEK